MFVIVDCQVEWINTVMKKVLRNEYDKHTALRDFLKTIIYNEFDKSLHFSC